MPPNNMNDQALQQQEHLNLRLENDKMNPKMYQLSNQEIQNALANMKTFKVTQKFKQLTIAYIVTHLLSKNERKPLAKLFQEINKDNDGVISKKEMSQAFATYFGTPIEEEEINKMYSLIDVSGSGEIEYTEFMLACLPEKVLLTNENLATVFKIFDDDGSGEITKDEIKLVFSMFCQKISNKVAK
jgi:calcium-dependent protein kinase